MISTRDEILNYIIRKSTNLDFRAISDLSANAISGKLNISRSLASQYLNEFFKEGVFIKISSRPVYFLHKPSIEMQFNIEIKEDTFLSVNDLMNEITRQAGLKRNFMKVIGFDGTLKFLIDQIKASLKYPPNGLPIIIYGEQGTGKALLCKMMYEFTLESNIITETSKFITIPVQNGKEGNDDFIGKLFGVGQNKGLLEEVSGGIICISNVQNLSFDNQYRLQKLLEEGKYSSIGNDKEIKNLDCRIVFVTEAIPNEGLTPDLLQCFPVICSIPTLEERSLKEKEELIALFFKGEAMRLNKRIFVSSTAMRTFIQYKYTQNIDQLKKIITSICARANLKGNIEEQKDIYIRLYDLPEEMLLNLNNFDISSHEEIDFINILEYKGSNDSEKIIKLFDSIINNFKNNNKTPSEIQKFMDESFVDLKQYYDLIVFKKQYFNSKIRTIEHSVGLAIENVLASHNINLPVNSIALISRIIYLNEEYNSSLNTWIKKSSSEIDICLSALQKYYSDESYIVERIEQSIKSNLEIELDNMNKILLIINLYHYNNELIQRRYLGIIIAHGHTTASSIADASNTLLGSYLFDAFNMPLDTSMVDVVEKLKKYIDRSAVKSDVILLVDMGSLEDIDIQLNGISNKNIGIINNVSTRLALDVGEQILKGNDMEDILEKACSNSKSAYKFIKGRGKKDAIIFISENGLHMANRMKDLFINSLPIPIYVEIISMDYNELVLNSVPRPFLENYNILFISGTSGLNVKGEFFVPIEEMVSFKNIGTIKKQLSPYLNASELELFSQNLIKNFSLENIVSNLTILDANKLLDFVAEAVEQMQIELQTEFTGKTMVGMYIHMSCLVERLVTKEPIETNYGLEEFENNHGDFIKIVKDSFSNICRHYRVDIPLSEIAYLYDYVVEDGLIENY